MPASGIKKFGNQTYMFTDWSLKSTMAKTIASNLRSQGKQVRVVKEKRTKNHPTMYQVYVKKGRK